MGPYNLGNTAPACTPCNMMKGCMDVCTATRVCRHIATYRVRPPTDLSRTCYTASPLQNRWNNRSRTSVECALICMHTSLHTALACVHRGWAPMGCSQSASRTTLANAAEAVILLRVRRISSQTRSLNSSSPTPATTAVRAICSYCSQGQHYQ